MLCPEPVSLGPVTGEHIGFRLDYARYVEHERLRHWLAEDIDALDRSAIVQVRDAGGRNRSRRSSRVEIGNRRAEARAARQHACELMIQHVILWRMRDHDIGIDPADQFHRAADVWR